MDNTSDLQRVIRVVEWLIFTQVVENRRDLADRMGYTESSLSQILNGKVSLSGKFIKKLANMSSDINEDWLFNGSGEMIKGENADVPLTGSDLVSMPREVWATIQDMAASLRAKDESMLAKDKSLAIKDQQTSELIALLKWQMNKKGEDVDDQSHAAQTAAHG